MNAEMGNFPLDETFAHPKQKWFSIFENHRVAKQALKRSGLHRAILRQAHLELLLTRASTCVYNGNWDYKSTKWKEAVYVYVHPHTYIHTYTYVCGVRVHTHTHTHTHTRTCVRTRTYPHTRPRPNDNYLSARASSLLHI